MWLKRVGGHWMNKQSCWIRGVAFLRILNTSYSRIERTGIILIGLSYVGGSEGPAMGAVCVRTLVFLLA